MGRSVCRNGKLRKYRWTEEASSRKRLQCTSSPSQPFSSNLHKPGLHKIKATLELERRGEKVGERWRFDQTSPTRLNALCCTNEAENRLTGEARRKRTFKTDSPVSSLIRIENITTAGCILKREGTTVHSNEAGGKEKKRTGGEKIPRVCTRVSRELHRSYCICALL